MAVPYKFPVVDERLNKAIKLEVRTIFSEESGLQNLVSTDIALIDLRAIAPSSLEPEKIANDCDFLKQVVSNHPEQLGQLITELQAGTASGIDNAESIIKDIGLTEEESAKAGGGLIRLIILAAAALLAAGCAGPGREKPFVAPTHPQPIGTPDAGPPDAGPGG